MLFARISRPLKHVMWMVTVLCAVHKDVNAVNSFTFLGKEENIQSTILLLLKKIEKGVEDFQEIYQRPVSVIYPDMSKWNEQSRWGEKKMALVDSPRNSEIVRMFLSGLMASTFAGGLIVGNQYGYFNHHTLSSSGKTQLGVAGLMLGILGSIIVGSWRYQWFKEYDVIYQDGKQKYRSAEQEKSMLRAIAQKKADDHRSFSLKRLLETLIKESSELYEVLENTFFNKEVNKLKKQTRKLKEEYGNLHFDYQLQKPTEEMLEMALVPQYKTVTSTVTREIQKERSRGFQDTHSSYKNEQQNSQNNSKQKTSMEQNTQPSYNPYAPPPYNPEWMAANQPLPSAPPINQPQVNHQSFSQNQSSQISQSSTTHRNNSNHDHDKNRLVTVEKRVLDEEKNSKAKLKVKTFRGFYKTLNSIEDICNTLHEKLFQYNKK